MSATAEKTSRIWGSSSATLNAVRPRMLRVRQLGPNVRRALQTFLNEQVRDWRPDAILVVERSGTAILRALKESGQLDWPWSRVISSACLHQVPPQQLAGQRILVFDDTMRSGEHLKGVLGAI